MLVGLRHGCSLENSRERGRDGFDQMSLGSVAQAVLQYAPCPVGVVRQAA